MTFRNPDDNLNQDGRGSLEQLVRWRRDVRRFRADAVPDELIDRLLRLADLAPSVGNSQPWRIVNVRSAETRADSTPRRSILQSFVIGTRFRGMGSGGKRCPRRSIIRAPAW